MVEEERAYSMNSGTVTEVAPPRHIMRFLSSLGEPSQRIIRSGRGASPTDSCVAPCL